MLNSFCGKTSSRRGVRAIALIMAILCALLTACAGGTDTDDPTSAADGVTTGSADDNGGTDDTTAEPDGGDTDTDGALEDGDDSYATTTAAMFSAEALEQVRQFQAVAEELPLDDIPSAAELLKTYRELAAEGPVNDALFFAYEENMQSICSGMNDMYQEEAADEATVNSALENGFLYVAEETPPYFILRPDFLYDTFRNSVGKNTEAFLALLAKHYGFHENYDFIERATLMVTLDQLAEMIVDWENYVNTYPDAVNLQDIVANLDYYLKIFIGSIQVENSGFYSIAGEDENGETLYKLLDEPRQSYLKFTENYQDSVACPVIAELYKIYEDNNFLYSVAVEEFFRAYGLAYDV